MTIDPNPRPAGTMYGDTTVDWLARPGTCPAVTVGKRLGWAGLSNCDRDLALQWHRAIPPQDVTEGAAIAAMALLIHDLGGAEILRALPIGSGGDYLIQLKGLDGPIQVECSGIRSDADGAQGRA